MQCAFRKLNEMQPLYSTHELELRHQAIAHQAQIILKDEGSRRIRVRRHIEGTEMEELRSQLTFKDQKIQEFQSQLQQAESANKLDKEALASIQTLFTAQSRDLQCLKVWYPNLVLTISVLTRNPRFRPSLAQAVLQQRIQHKSCLKNCVLPGS